ncbi:MAG: diguanylate cyclase [Eubacterium sp.]|nr:diguanylate cyclase [Eubacterium sp.]
MGNDRANKYRILIADDSELNRELLSEMLQEEYDIVEAKDGKEAVAILREQSQEISLVLLDIVMPQMDGFEVLTYMNTYHWLDDIPVIIISSENSSSFMQKAYDFGATDYISRPFDAMVVHRRVVNTIMLYAKQRKLTGMVAEQIYEKEKTNKLMVSILSHIVEFRNGESGLHIIHIHMLTELLLKHLVKKTDQYRLSAADISLISNASALHDIGKITIPDEILNKPGRLTAEEFEIMKQHSRAGALMLWEMPLYQGEPLLKVAYEICRWHHERYDGNGYPDGLSGEEIPISAQIVALADVYDALTSERCYKKAFSHDTAVEMILNGQCGAFNPLLLECFSEAEEEIRQSVKAHYEADYSKKEIRDVAGELMQHKELGAPERMLRLLELEKTKFQFLASKSDDIVFSFTNEPPTLSLAGEKAEKLGLGELVIDPYHDERVRKILGNSNLERLSERISKTTPEEPKFQLDFEMLIDGEFCLSRFDGMAIWLTSDHTAPGGAVGRISDVQKEYAQIDHDKRAAMDCVLKSGREHAVQNHFPVGNKMTGQEAWILMENLKLAFDQVRLVDATVTTAIRVGEDGEMVEEPYHCHRVWGREERCENCVSAKVLSTKDRLSKFEFMGDDIYHVIAMYVEVEGQPFSIEMISQIVDEALLTGHGRNKIVESIVKHSKKLFADPVTKVYNRRYFEEQVRGRQEIGAVAMIDADNFKSINDSFGHHAGDLALQAIAAAILSCIREEDVVIRYGGDEFVLVFQQIPSNIFSERLEEIRKKVCQIVLSEYPEIHLSVSIGGVYGEGKVDDQIIAADKLLYQAKDRKNSVCIELNET